MNRFVMLFVVLVPVVCLRADEEVVDGVTWYYSVSSGEASITSGQNKYEGNLTVPLQLGGCPVTGVSSSAFSGCTGLTSVVIPTNVTCIGSAAFSGCSSLTNMVLPFVGAKRGNKETASSLFGYIFGSSSASGMTSVEQYYSSIAYSSATYYIPSSLKSVEIAGETAIGYGAFYGCSMLSAVTMSSGVASIGERAFFGCSGLTSIDIPSRATSIGDWAFSGCSGLTSVTIPSSVTSIGRSAFLDCVGLTSVTIPSSVTSIGSFAYSGCSSLTNMVLPFVGAKRGNAGTADSLLGYIFGSSSAPGMRPVQQYYSSGSSKVYYFPSSLRSVKVADETVIGYGAFYGCNMLTEVTISARVKSIGSYAFSDCSGLTSVTMPESVTSVGGAAFCGCSGLTSVTIPSSVTSIGSSAFSGCSGLKTVEIADVGAWCGIAFGDAGANPMSVAHGFCLDGVAVTDLKVPDGVTNIRDYAFWGCSKLMSVTIPSSVTSIGNSAFSGCAGLTSVTIPFCVVKLSVVFPDVYTRIQKVVILDGVTSIGNSAFSGCTGLTSVTIPTSVTSIGNSAFYDCSGLMTVTVPTNVTSIGNSAFSGCTGLTEVTIPSSVTSIGDYAFSGCDALIDDDDDGYVVCDGWLVGYRKNAADEIDGLDDVLGVVGGALTGCKSIVRLEFSDASKLKSVGTAAFKECTELRTMILPPSLQTIGNEAFMGCSYLSNVIIPGRVRTVGARAFKNCTGFTAALIEHGVTSIGEECFYGDWQISEVDLPSTVSSIGLNAFGGDSSIVRVGLRGDCRSVKTIFSNYTQIKEATVRSGSAKIVSGLFSGCSALKVVHFQGNAPRLTDTTIYEGTPSSLVTYVEPTSTGWDGTTGSHVLPQSWPLSGSYRRPIAFWDVPTYLCRFDSNGGSLGVQDTYQYSEKTIVLPPEPVQSGYKFAGWWTQPVGGLRVTEKTIFIEGVYTYLWAHWVKGHTVFLDPNGGEVMNGFVTYVDESVYGVLPTPVRSGYAFNGWHYNGERIKPDTRINKLADHTLIAQWTANKYKVKYHPNGGVGGDVVEDWVYGEVGFLRRNSFVREGFEFLGWATSEDGDAVVYTDGQSVSNLQAEEGAVSELWAVWRESDAVDPTNVELFFGGNADWEAVYRIVSTQIEDHVVNTPVLWQSGRITDNEHSDMKARVFGAGTIGFWWKVSCEKFRKEKLDHLSFSVDGNEMDWINGKTEWAYVEFRVDEIEPHEFVWSYAKDGMDSDGEDCGFVCAVVWTPRLETLEDYAGTTNLALVTNGDADWQGVTNVARNRSGCVRSGKIVDGQESRLEAIAEGEGVIEFWWKTDCERFRDYKIDRVAFYVDGSELAWTNGVTDWRYQRFMVSGVGAHTLSWMYIKDDEGTAGEDCAWVSEINWIPAGAEVIVPSVIGDDNVTVTGDAETGFVIKPSEGKTAVEVTIPQGVDAAKVTVEVSVKVASVKPNGAKVKIVSGGADITEFLNVPAVDGNGVVDLMKATGKEEIVKEAMDVEKGAKIELDAANPTLITPNTRVGLFYQLREGETLGGMKNGDSTIGDGNPWKPEIKVKGGNSAFYSIGVGKGE